MKYRSRKTVCNQLHTHASQKEARRCDELTILEKTGIIKQLKQQPKFVLQEKFKLNGKTYRPITYMADFSYYDVEANKFIVEDVKGFKTKVYNLKKKMLLYIMRDRHDFNFIET